METGDKSVASFAERRRKMVSALCTASLSARPAEKSKYVEKRGALLLA